MAERRPWGRFRSMLFTPGHKADWAAKAVASGADAVILDLEDSVPDEGKADARAAVATSLLGDTGTARFVRVNGWGSGALVDDVLAVHGEGLDGIVLPKVTGSADVVALDRLLAELAVRDGRTGPPVEIVPLCETAAAILDRRHVYAASTRVRRGVTGGVGTPHGDTARALGFHESPSGEETAHLLSQSVLEGRAAGLVNVFGGMGTEVRDLDAVRRLAERARRFGADGLLAIHPSHIAVIHDVFRPTVEELATARAIVAAVEAAGLRGDAAVVVDGRMVDVAHVTTSRRLLEQQEGSS